MPTPIPPVHLAENTAGAKRTLTTGRAFPLGELDRPGRSSGTAAELNRIVRYLDVEVNARYAPTPSSTFCNIYACDYCYLAGAYLPRVWWTPKALADLRLARPVLATYGETVIELNANALYIWLRDLGPTFGWSGVASLDELQQAANSGHVSVICAQRNPLSKPGHIAVVVPESAPLAVAETSSTGIRVPLQSQAGRRNYGFSCQPGRWWENRQFQEYGFWVHK